MKYRLTVIVLGLMGLCSNSCGDASNGKDPIGGDPNGKRKPEQELTSCDGPAPAGEFIVNDMEANAYYKQLVSQPKGRDETHLTNSNDASFFSQEEFEPYVGLSIYMHADETYVAQYEEGLAKAFNYNTLFTDAKYKDTFKGKWCVRGTKLIFDSLGDADGVNINSLPAIYFRFSKDVSKEGPITYDKAYLMRSVYTL